MPGISRESAKPILEQLVAIINALTPSFSDWSTTGGFHAKVLTMQVSYLVSVIIDVVLLQALIISISVVVITDCCHHPACVNCLGVLHLSMP